jgi:hypothetical protein
MENIEYEWKIIQYNANGKLWHTNGWYRIQIETYIIQMENYRIQIENYTIQMENYTIQNCTIQMENYTIQMEKIKYCNVWHAIQIWYFYSKSRFKNNEFNYLHSVVMYTLSMPRSSQSTATYL